jgi:putative acetyltransferase
LEPGESAALVRVFAESVRAISVKEYSAEQLAVWVEAFGDPERWVGERAGRVVKVAETEGEVAGFATLEPDGHIDHLYVHPRFQRRGIATALLEDVEGTATGLGLTRIFTEASVLARPIFEQAGFGVIERRTVTRRGIAFVNFRMEKILRGVGSRIS